MSDIQKVEVPEPQPRPMLLEDVKRLHLEPGDILVVKCARMLTAEETRMIHSLARQVFGEHQKIVVIDNNMSFEVYRGSSKATERGDSACEAGEKVSTDEGRPGCSGGLS